MQLSERMAAFRTIGSDGGWQQRAQSLLRNPQWRQSWATRLRGSRDLQSIVGWPLYQRWHVDIEKRPCHDRLMSRVFSREKFYELVWSKPMTHLAKEFTLSDVALHKICSKHGIPNPPLGWWAKKAAGKKVSRTPLPKATKGSPAQITIAGGELRGEDEAIMSVREQARIRASSAPPAEARPNPLIERTVTRLRKAKTGPSGLVSIEGNGLIKCAVAPGSIDRLEIILNGIVAAAAQQGFDLAAEGQEACFVGEVERVSLSVTEVVKRVKHELTDKERVEEERWNRKRERASLRNEWSEIFFSRPQFPEWDYLPIGQLSFELEHVYIWNGQSPRRSFRDGKVQRLETMASDIAVGLAVLAAAKTAQRLRQEAEQRRIKEERRLRELALRSRHVEERRIDALQAILAEIEEIERFRRLLEKLRQSSGDIAELRVAEFMQWAEGYLAVREAAMGPEGLSRRFEEQRLFGDDDDHAFRAPHWF